MSTPNAYDISDWYSLGLDGVEKRILMLTDEATLEKVKPLLIKHHSLSVSLRALLSESCYKLIHS